VATDGVWDVLGEEEVARLVQDANEDAQMATLSIVQTYVYAALKNDPQSNITILFNNYAVPRRDGIETPKDDGTTSPLLWCC
jgi:serine/threonine protein phosphatase PrpC